MRDRFDEIINRSGTNAENVEAFRQSLFGARGKDMEFPYPDNEMIRMWVADMDFAVADEILAAMRARLDHGIFGYTSVFDSAYYKAFSRWTQTRYGWHVDREALLTDSGVVPTLNELVDCICASDEKLLIFTPSYGPFLRAAVRNGRQCLCSDLVRVDGHYTMDFDDLTAKLSDPKLRLCIFCNPHNPTGRLWSKEELDRFGALCMEHDVWIISDEIHCDLLRSGKVHIPLAACFPAYQKIITCMAPSKTFNLAGLMFSNVIIPGPELRKTWRKRRHNSVNPLSLAAAQAAYEHGSGWLEQLLHYLDESFAIVQRWLFKELPKARFEIPEATYLAWIDLGAYFAPGENLMEFFATQAGVLVEGGSMFVQNGDGFIRLNLACPHSVVEEAIGRICAAVQRREAEKEG